MPTETILVQGKSDPERGKKRGRIKSDTGKLFQAVPELLNKVVVGETYDILYKDESFGEANYRVAQAVYPANGSPPAPSPQQQAAPRPQTQSTSAAPLVDYKSEEIACLAILKCFDPMEPDAVAVAAALKEAALGLRVFRKWQRTGNVETSKQAILDEFDDEIPY